MIKITVPENKKIYFASDFHLGAPDVQRSLQREKRIVKWLQHIATDAAALFLVGDIFDFWCEYKTVIPRGFTRFLGTLAHLSDSGIPIYIFTGNHDMWTTNYLQEELNAAVFKKPQVFLFNDTKCYIGHGDGLGPGDKRYKIIKKYLFSPAICQWLFRAIHPNLGIGLATAWSNSSRHSHDEADKVFLGENEWLWQYSKEIEQQAHHDFYIFGHRHLPLFLPVSENSTYVNLGEWINYDTFAVFDSGKIELSSAK
jgi:UDP-2,3-diacylglucosamine hydrolase